MIKQSKNLELEIRKAMRGGQGEVGLTNLLSPDELNNKGRLFAKLTFEKNCGIGYHIHENESEIFYVLKGTASYCDNGTEVTLNQGDVAITSSGMGHSICNKENDVLEVIALIVNA